MPAEVPLNKIMMVAVGLSLAASFAVACSSSSPAADPPYSADGGSGAPGDASVSTSDLPCDVSKVMVDSCQSCHSSPPKFGAPMPLVTYADLHADSKLTPGKKVFEVVGTRIHDDAAPMPQAPNARLSPSDTATLDAWIAGGAAAGTTTCGDTDGGVGGPAPLSCTPDQILRPTTKFNVTTDPDLYVCYGFDTDASQKRQVIAGAPHIDNKSVVHHVLLYQADDTVSGTPAPCGAGGGQNWRLVTGWAPGGKNFELPPEAGFAEETGTTHWAVQIHYNNAQGLLNQVDATGYDLCSTDQLRPNDADILATGTIQIQIPPRSTYEADCDLTFPEQYGKINVISSWAHMHRLGRAQSAVRSRTGAADETILDAPTYDFNTGAGANTVNVELAGGDNIHTMCRWQNAGDSEVTFGEATSNEMCFAFLTYYPKITVPKFKWAAPASPIVSKCTTKVVP